MSWQILRLQALKRDKHTCQICHKLEAKHVHHVIPVRKHGLNVLENLVSVCTKCHGLIELDPKTAVPKICVALDRDLKELIYDSQHAHETLSDTLRRLLKK